jgi:uncharacterized protein
MSNVTPDQPITPTSAGTAPAVRPAFHVMTKPIGAICNIDCKYCYYLEKEELYPDTRNFRMTDATLENYVRQYIEAQSAPEISFAWQGGEPTLLGVDFFRKAVALQKKYCPPGKRITNALQTNGTLLNAEWCDFFRENTFLIGLSIDGPRDLHDYYRVDKGGNPTFDKVMNGLELLKAHRVEYNTLTVVNRQNSRRPLDVYNFLKQHGSGFMQFIPLVERVGEGHGFAAPPDPANLDDSGKALPVTPWSVESNQYGEFLNTIFDEWVRNDVGNVFIQLFEVQLAIWLGNPAALCVFAETCGGAMAMEHNGDLYSCDHYVYEKFKLGNINETPIATLANSAVQNKFGLDKRDALPKYCRECDVRFACNGECPKHRFIKTPDGEEGLNYLCAGYKRFFHHIDPYMKQMGELVRARKPASLIMTQLARQRRKA